MRSADYVIIGAGISGIALARELTRAGKSVVIIEKARGVGGRISTRRLGDDIANQGLGAFEIHNKKLLDLAEAGVEAGILKINGTICEPVRGINAWMKLLSEGLVILTEKQVARLTQEEEGYSLLDKEDNQIFSAKNVVLTAPAPQTWEILKKSGIEIAALKEIVYGPCVRLYFKMKPGIPSPKISEIFEEPRLERGLYTANMLSEKVEHYLDFDKDVIRDDVLRTFGLKPEDFEHFYVHKWKYSRALNHVPHSTQILKSFPGIYLAGDYFSGTDINGVIESVDYLLTELLRA